MSVKIETGFTVSLPVHEAWPLLTDLERVAPLMPGVVIDAVEDDGLRATMRVKVGPVHAAYRMRVRIDSLDSTMHTAVLKASGRETQGPGTVEATVIAALTDAAGATAVALSTDLTVTGRVAQFGGGVMTEVADRLLVQFTERLEADLGAAEAESTPAPVLDLGPTARHLLLRAAGRIALLAAPLLLVALRRRRRRLR